MSGSPPIFSPDAVAEAVLAMQRRRRQRVSRTLHDDVGQVLSAIGVELDLMKMDLSGKLPELGKRVSAVQQTLQKAFDQVRNTTYEVLPDIMDRIGVIPALERLASRLRLRDGGWVEIALEADPVLSPQEAAAYYVIAEWLCDEAIRRSPDAKILITVASQKMGITHNAVPPDENDPHWRLCLAIMEYTAKEANLLFQLTRDPDLGTIIEVSRKEVSQSEETAENAV